MIYKWKVSLFLMVGALGLIFLTTGSAYAACPDSITNYWKLDETTPGAYADFINGNDGAGNLDPTVATGQVNGAQQFNGTDQEIDVDPDSSFGWYNDDSFSIEFWIRRNGAVSGANQVVIGRDDGNVATSLHWWVGIQGAGANVARFTLGDNDGGNVTALTGTTDLTDNTWHHVVAVRDRSLGANGQNLLYVDGQLDVPAAVDASYDAGFYSPTATLIMGALAGSYHFGGLLDEVALYDRALTAAEIQDHYDDGLAGLDHCLGSGPPSDAPYPEGTVSHWKLDETTPGAYADSFNGNDGAGNLDPTVATGQVNGAQHFNGTDQKIDVDPDSSFGWYNDDSFSIEFWIRRNGAVSGANQVVIGRDDGNVATSLHWWVGIEGGGANVARFTLGDNDGGNVTAFSGTTDLTDNIWHHVVAVRARSLGANGQNLLYVDGQLDIPAAVDASYDAGFYSPTATLNMGALAGSYPFGGLLDEVALYDRALPLVEIEKHHTDGLAGHGIDYVPPVVLPSGGGNGGGCFIATMAE